ncbi:MAG: SEC-C metal-binding domain-containing protein, partial [Frankiaceae bacterium]
PCWCGSHATYAECCARVSAQPAEATVDPPPILAS